MIHSRSASRARFFHETPQVRNDQTAQYDHKGAGLVRGVQYSQARGPRGAARQR